MFYKQAHMPLISIFTIISSPSMIKKTTARSLKSSHVYDLNLLEERNAVLSLENQQLLQQVEDLQSQLSQSNEQQSSMQKDCLKIQKEHSQILLLLERRISTLAQYSQQIMRCDKKKQRNQDKQSDQNYQQIIMLAQMSQSSDTRSKNPIWMINQIFEPIESIFGSIHNTQQSAKEFSRIQENLNRRKKLHHKKCIEKEVIHVVREPAVSRNSSVEDLIQNQNQVQYTIMCYQKLLRRVSHLVQFRNYHQIGVELRNICQIRKSAIKLEAMLQDCERQIQLGIKSSLLVEDLNHKMLELRAQDHQTRNKIETMIASL